MNNQEHLKAFENYLLYEVKRRPNTVSTYLKMVKPLLEIINKDPETWVVRDIEEYVANINRQVSEGLLDSNSLHVVFSGISCFLKYLYVKYDKEFKFKNLELLKAPPIIHKPISILTDEEVDLVLSVAKGLSKRDYAITFLLLQSGNRAGETVLANTKDITPPSGNTPPKIDVWQEKQQRFIRRTISSECYEVIQDYLQHREPCLETPEPLFTNGEGRRGTYQMYRFLMQRIGYKAGLPPGKLHCHGLRHQCFTNMGKSGMTNQQIKAHSGHSKSDSLDKYVNLTDKDIEKQVINSYKQHKTNSIPTPTPKITQIEKPIPPEKPTPQKKDDIEAYTTLLKSGLLNPDVTLTQFRETFNGLTVN